MIDIIVFLLLAFSAPPMPHYAVQGEVSYYTASVEETDSSPCETADMTWICPAKLEIVANNCLDFGTRVEIEGVIYEVHDRMNKKYNCNNFDILLKNKQEAFKKGRQSLEVKIYVN